MLPRVAETTDQPEMVRAPELDGALKILKIVGAAPAHRISRAKIAGDRHQKRAAIRRAVWLGWLRVQNDQLALTPAGVEAYELALEAERDGQLLEMVRPA